MGFTLEVSIFSHLLTAGGRTIFTDKMKITDNDMYSISLIKLLRFHNLSVGDICTDKPQNREKLLIKPKIH